MSSANDPLATQPDQPAATSTRGLPIIPGYELLGELGRGGMAVVYKARHLSLNRLVALKMILAGEFASDSEIARFRIEAESVAALQHPNVVQIHEVGEVDGRPFLALEFVEGGSLAERLTGTPWPPRAAAALVRTLAQAVEMAHQRGVVHRDLKPGNVLLAPTGAAADGEPLAGFLPKVADFGLAKRLDANQAHTASGAILGTPSYMAPEQASGKTSLTSPATDVYALGIILYELLTGRPPFLAESRLDTLLQVLGDEPVSPRRLNPSLPRDLETIVLKCVEKEPHRRYASAAALADDLGRFLEGQPVQARPVGPVERLLKWARRRPAAAALVAVSIAALVALFGGGLYFTGQLSEALEAIRKENAAARANEQLAREEQQKADNERQRAERELSRSRRMLMTTRLVQASSVGDRNPVAALRVLHDSEACPFDLRDFTWRLLAQRYRRELLSLPGPFQGNSAVSLSSDGLTLACEGEGRKALLCDARSGQERLLSPGPISAIAFRPGSGEVFTLEPKAIRVWDSGTGKELRSIAASAASLTFSPDGKWLATTWNTQVMVWDAVSGQRLQALAGHTQLVNGVAFSPDGKLLASAGEDRAVRVWEVQTGKSRAVFSQQPGPAFAVSWVDGGRQLAVAVGEMRGRGSAVVRLLEADTGIERRSLRDFVGEVWVLRASPDGRILAGGTGGVQTNGHELPGEVILWKVDGSEPPLTLAGHQGGIHALDFSVSGDRLAVASGGADRLGGGLTGGGIKLWNVAPVRGRAAPHPDTDEYGLVLLQSLPGGQFLTASNNQVARQNTSGERRDVVVLKPGERKLLTVSPDRKYAVFTGTRWPQHGTIYLLDLASGQERILLGQQRSAAVAGAFSADSTTLAVSHPQGTVRLFDLRGTGVRVLQAHNGTPEGLAFSPDGKILATAGAVDRTQKGEVAFWEVQSGRRLAVGRGHPWRPSSLVFSPDGKMLASADRARVVGLWEVPTARLLGLYQQHSGEVLALAFSPDGQTLASGGKAVGRPGEFSEILLWDVLTGEVRARLEQPHAVSALAFADDGQTLVSGTRQGSITFWDAPDPVERAILPAHQQLVWSLSITPDSKLLTTGGRDDTAKIWDLRSGKQLLAVSGETGLGWSSAVSPDGKILAVSSEAGPIRLWDVSTGRQLGSLTGHKGRVSRLAFRGDGLLASVGVHSRDDSEIHLWNPVKQELVATLPVRPGSAEALVWSPDGTTLLAGYSEGTLRWWDMPGKSERRAIKVHRGPITSLAITADGRSIFTGSREKTVKHLDFSGKEVRTWQVHREVYCVAVSPDGELLAWAGWDTAVRVWRVADGESATVLSGHSRAVSTVAFSPDGRSLVSGDFGGTIRLWDATRLPRKR